MALSRALLSGAAGAATVTFVHQAARSRFRSAPRVDVIGMRGLRKLWHAFGRAAPTRRRLYRQALAGELLSNGAYYALTSVGSPKHPLARGSILGVLAGLGAVFLPERLGLGRRPVRRTRRTALQTFAWYLLGGVASGGVSRIAR